MRRICSFFSRADGWLGIGLVAVGYSLVWCLDRVYMWLGKLDREQNGRHWDR